MKQVRNGYTGPWPGGSGGAGLPPQFCLAPKPAFSYFSSGAWTWISWSRNTSRQTWEGGRRTWSHQLHILPHMDIEKNHKGQNCFYCHDEKILTLKTRKNCVTDYKWKGFCWHTVTELSSGPLRAYVMGCVRRWLLHLSFHLPLYLPSSQKNNTKWRKVTHGFVKIILQNVSQDPKTSFNTESLCKEILNFTLRAAFEYPSATQRNSKCHPQCHTQLP